MAILSRRMSTSLIAAAVLAVLAAAPSLAQVSPGNARVGPAGGTPSTTAPSNSEGTPSGGTGVVGQTQVGGGGYQAGSGDTYTPQRRVRRARTVRRNRRAARRAAMRRPAPAAQSQGGIADTTSSGAYNGGTGVGPSSGLNGSNRQSDTPR